MSHFAEQIYENQPLNAPGMWNRLDYRPLEGFVYAVTPFNFTSIGDESFVRARIMGNTRHLEACQFDGLQQLLHLQVVRSRGPAAGRHQFRARQRRPISDVLLNDPDLAGIHFTGSTEVFQTMWRTVGENITKYKTYPRLVGETGGKDFILAHASAEPDALITAIVRGGFEYQGQKCSAASRVYIPDNMWKRIKDRLIETTNSHLDGRRRGLPEFHGRRDRPRRHSRNCPDISKRRAVLTMRRS